MSPSNIQSPHQEENDGHHTLEYMKAFQHSRNMTGVVGDSTQWNSDIKVNELWDKLSVAEPCGKNKTDYYTFTNILCLKMFLLCKNQLFLMSLTRWLGLISIVMTLLVTKQPLIGK